MFAVALLSSVLVLVAGHQSDSARGPHHPRGTVATHQHYRPHRPPDDGDVKLTQDPDLLQDAQHIREDLGGWMTEEDTKKMSAEELEFHYFKLHDFDNNTKLDGLEILQAIHHTIHHNAAQEGQEEDSHAAISDFQSAPGIEQSKEEEDLVYFVELIDRVLSEDDLDNDGYLSYVEYVLGRQKQTSKT